jgi:hypothetical protein
MLSITAAGGSGAISRRHLNTWLAFTSWRRATIETDAPGASLSATIRRFDTSDHSRRLGLPELRLVSAKPLVHAEREKIYNQQHELEGKLADINRELGAIDAYEAAKTGKAVRQSAGQARGARARPQARRGSKRDALLQLIKDNPSGLVRGEILERMGLKGDKSGEMSVSNALTALTKANQVTRRDGRYVAA